MSGSPLLPGMFVIMQVFVEICVAAFMLKMYLLTSFRPFKVKIINFPMLSGDLSNHYIKYFK